MGRHNRTVDSALRRNSVIALTGLGAVGIVSAGAASAAPQTFTTAAASQPAPEPAPQAVALADVAESFTPASTVASTSPTVTPAADAVKAPEELTKQPTTLAPTVPGPLGLPPINFAAYQNAERILAQENPGCGMYWQLLAGVGQVESSQSVGNVADNGDLIQPVIGLPLNGSLPGQAVINDTDGGALDGDPVYDRAVGPTQFIPSTWTKYAADGNGDGKADPQNLYDSALTTGKYLCDGNLDMRNIAQAGQAIHRYNNSMAYVANVLAWSTAYSSGFAPNPADLQRIH